MLLDQAGDLWSGVGQGVANAEGWMVVAALLVLGALFITARYIVPSRERIRGRELDIREREAENELDTQELGVALPF